MSTLDCRQCGACCVTPDDSLCCGLTEADRERIGWWWGRSRLEAPVSEAPAEIVAVLRRRWRGYATGPLAGKRLSQCVALDGDVLGAVRCLRHSRRPDACRELEVGSEGCLAARRRIGA